MTTIIHNHNCSNLDSEDRLAVDMIVNQENERLTNENARRSALDPPVALLPLIGPTNAERKTFYETYLKDKVSRMHLRWIQDAKDKRSELARIRAIRQQLALATDAELTQIEGIFG